MTNKLYPHNSWSDSLITKKPSNFLREMYNHFLTQCHPCPIWLVLPLSLNLAYNSLILVLLLSIYLSCRDSWHYRSHVNYPLFMYLQIIRFSSIICVIFRNMSPTWSSKLEDYPLLDVRDCYELSNFPMAVQIPGKETYFRRGTFEIDADMLNVRRLGQFFKKFKWKK